MSKPKNEKGSLGSFPMGVSRITRKFRDDVLVLPTPKQKYIPSPKKGTHSPRVSKKKAFSSIDLETISHTNGEDLSEFPFHQSKIISPTVACRIGFFLGPDDGFLELFDEQNLASRKAKLQIMQKDPFPEPKESTLESVPTITADVIKFKINGLKCLSKRMKRMQPSIATNRSRKDRRVYGKTIDTYAYDAIKKEKAGQPNADSFCADTFNNVICFGVADGIGWGIPSRRASQSALFGFISYFTELDYKKKFKKYDTELLARTCLNALNEAHYSTHCFTEGKTTFSGGVLVELEHPSSDGGSSANSGAEKNSPFSHQFTGESFGSLSSFEDIRREESLREPLSFSSSMSGDQDDTNSDLDSDSGDRSLWMFVSVSVGDTLMYRYSTRRDRVEEITQCDRAGGVRDAGGSLGGILPDLRNLSVQFCLLEEEDFIIACSDGVHDNLDPEVLQIPVQEASGMASAESWRALSDEQKNVIKREYKEQKLLSIIHSVGDLTSKSITNAVIDFVEGTTQLQREGYERASVLQRDWDILDETLRNETNTWVQTTLKDPVGKFDHVTCLCIQAMRNS